MPDLALSRSVAEELGAARYALPGAPKQRSAPSP